MGHPQNPKPPRIPREPGDTLVQLKKQYKFLCRSLLEIDQGDLDEVDRVAISLRILLHSRGPCKALLTQLDSKIEILDTCLDIPCRVLEGNNTENESQTFIGFKGGMICMTIGSSASWQLTPTKEPHFVTLDDWWNRVLFIDHGVEFTRNKLVRCIADTDGGAHVDTDLEREYFALSRLGSVGFSFAVNGNKHIPQGPEKLIIPHIGHEVVYSLKRAFPELCPECSVPDPTQKF